MVIFIYYVRNTTIINRGRDTPIHNLSHSLHGANNQLNSFLSKNETVDNLRRPFKKIFIAFGYWEQLAAATNNFLDLTDLAAYCGRQTVVPFVKDSLFYGLPTEKSSETLELYYDVSALNRTLRSRGHGTLISWKEFQDVCQGKLDVLVQFDYTNLNKTKKIYNQGTRAFFPCQDHRRNTFGELNATRTICMNVFAVDSVEKFENDEVIERLP